MRASLLPVRMSSPAREARRGDILAMEGVAPGASVAHREGQAEWGAFIPHSQRPPLAPAYPQRPCRHPGVSELFSFLCALDCFESWLTELSAPGSEAPGSACMSGSSGKPQTRDQGSQHEHVAGPRRHVRREGRQGSSGLSIRKLDLRQ